MAYFAPCLAFPPPLSSPPPPPRTLLSFSFRACTRGYARGPAWREAQSQREIKSINMWEAHATHSSVCSTRNNLRVSSSRASGRARAPEPREALVLRLDAEASISG